MKWTLKSEEQKTYINQTNNYEAYRIRKTLIRKNPEDMTSYMLDKYKNKKAMAYS